MKSRKRLSNHGRLQAGCVSGLINIFDFHNGRSTKRLLSNRWPSVKETAGHSVNGTVTGDHVQGSEIITENRAENERAVTDTAKASVKKLMEDDMLNEGCEASVSNSSEACSTANVVEKKLGQKAVSEMEAGTADKLVPEMIEELLGRINGECFTNNDFIGVLDMLSAQAVTATDQKLVAAVKLLMEQKLSNMRSSEDENQNSSCCEEFMDAVRIFTANYGLFLELLQESKSVLAKPIDHSASLNEKPEDTKSSSHKRLNLFRRSKSLRGKNTGCLPSLVILRPEAETDVAGSTTSLSAFRVSNKAQSERNTLFRFSFNEIKRKLWHAMGKEKAVVSSDKLMLQCSPTVQNRKRSEKCSLRENMRSRNHFSTERFTSSALRKSGELGKLKEKGKNTSLSQRFGWFNIHLEAKKHISEILKNASSSSSSLTRQLPMSLGRILSDPASCSPSRGGCGDATSFSDGTQASPLSQNRVDGDLQEDLGTSSDGQSLHKPCTVSGDADDGEEHLFKSDSSTQFGGEKTVSFESQGIHPEDAIQEGTCIGVWTRGASEIVEASCGSSNSSIGEDLHDAVAGNEAGCSPSLQSSTCLNEEEDRVVSSPAASSSLEDCDQCISKLERRSPVSVLEPSFIDDASSPASMISESDGGKVEPRLISFEEQCVASSDQGTCMRISMEEEESPFEYVEAVLLGSGLNWDEFRLRWLSSHKILDSSLFDEVELFSNRSRHDQRLLFDCANEALMGVCDLHISCSGKAKTSSLSCVDLLGEIWRQVEWLLFLQGQANSLDQLVRVDLARPGNWISFEPERELVGVEIQEAIWEQLVLETVLCFIMASSPAAAAV